MLDILTSQGGIMHLFSLKMAEVGGRTPLEIAIIRVNIPTVKLLLEYGAIHYIKKFDALYYSAVNGIKEMMMLLLRHGAMFHVRTIKIHSDLNDRFPIVNIIKNIEALVSPLIIKRLRKKDGVYINKEIIRELLYFLI